MIRFSDNVRRAVLVGALALALAVLGFDRYAAYMHVPGPEATRVVIYTTEWCTYCERLRQRLIASQVAYTEYDVEQSFQGQLGMWALHARGVPVAVIGPRVVRGYDVDKIESALQALGHDLRPPSPAPPSAREVHREPQRERRARE